MEIRPKAIDIDDIMTAQLVKTTNRTRVMQHDTSQENAVRYQRSFSYTDPQQMNHSPASPSQSNDAQQNNNNNANKIGNISPNYRLTNSRSESTMKRTYKRPDVERFM